MFKKILLVDDDSLVLNSTRRFLEDRGFKVSAADNGAEAVALARGSKPDLVITDAQMKGLDGFTLCRAIKETDGFERVPVIIISGSKVSEEDILAGYNRGADDYILKPFSFPVLLAKIKAVLKRYEGVAEKTEKISKLGMVIDPAGRTVTLAGAVVNLTRKEFDLLMALITEEGRLLSIPYLLETVWGYDPASYNDPHTVGVHVSSLRKKLGAEIGARLTSVTGHGYKLE
ncbi:MAG: DNA-binding response regulator [Elusimicrobia bacterium HGW-Elusimicrobia-3]|nr:MAG: DNA-binding response regulator [Elusimicrobia bacterium HGW-Elusimicrobia-3]